MHWFYGQLDTVFVNSEEYRQSWIKRGFDAAKLKILPRGLDTELFRPERRNPAFFEKLLARATDRSGFSTSAGFQKKKDLDGIGRRLPQIARRRAGNSTFCGRAWSLFASTF